MWNIEKDPILRSTILAVAVFDQPPDWRRLRRRIDRATRADPAAAPARAVAAVPHRTAPLDGRVHVRPRLPPAATPASRRRVTRRALLDALQPIATCSLRSGASAVGVHALRGARRRPRRARDEGAPLGHRRRRRHGVARRARRPRARTRTGPRGRSPRRARSGVVRLRRPRARLVRPTPVAACSGSPAGSPAASRRATFAALRDPAGRRRQRRSDRAFHRPDARTGDDADVARDARPRSRSLPRRCSNVALDDLKRTAKATEGSLNDVFVAAVVGGLRRYHERHGDASIESLRMTPADQPPHGRRRQWRQSLRAGALPGAHRDRRSRRARAGDRRTRARLARRTGAADDEHARRAS